MAESQNGGLVTELNAENPWPGPEAFRQQDAKFFFGRDRARDELTRLILQNRLVLLYGRSGLGKTSLLRAGVFPKLEQTATLPIYIRLQFGASAGTGVAPDLQLQMKTAIESAVSRANAEAPPLDPAATLWEWFYRVDAQFFNERSRRVRPVLVFDQFEEAFTHGRATPDLTAATDRFLDQLVDLIRGSVPASVAAQFEQDATLALKYVTDREVCGVLLAVRREFLAELLRLRPRLPALLERRFELSGMTLQDAEAVVVGAGGHLIEPGVEKLIASFVAAARRNTEDQTTDDTTVDPAILSIFCRELNNSRRDKKLPHITRGLVQGVQEEIIADFYRRGVADFPASVRDFIEEQLVTPSGFRNSVAWDQAVDDPEVEKAIAPLVDRRLIRVEGIPPRARIELTHDVLTEPIVQSRNVRRAQEAIERLRQEENRARVEAAKEEQRRREREELVNKRRELQVRTVTLAIVLVLLGGVGLLAITTYRAKTAGERNLSFAQVEQGLGLANANQAARGLAYVSRAIRTSADNATARSLALDALLHGNWPVPIAVRRERPGLVIVGAGAQDTMLLIRARSEENSVELWNTANRGTPLSSVKFDVPRIGAAAIARAKDRIAVAADDGTLHISSEGDPVVIPAHRSAILQVAFDGSGDRVVTASDDATAVVWNATTGARVLRLVKHKATVMSAQFSADGNSVVTASRDGTVIVWDVAGRQPRPRVTFDHGVPVFWAQFSHDGTRVLTAAEDRSVRVWNLQTGQQAGAPLEHTSPLISAGFAPDGQRIITVTSREVALWTLQGYPAMEPLQFDNGVTSAAFSADGRRIMTTTPEGTLTVWDVRRSAAAPNSAPAPCGIEAVLRFTAGGHEVAVACPDAGTIHMWDPDKGELRTMDPNPAWVGVTAIDFTGSSSGRVLAINGGRAILSRIGSADAITLAHGAQIHRAVFSRDGQLVATAGDDGTAVWDAQTGKPIARVARGMDSWSVQFTQDGARILTASGNGYAELFDARSGAAAGPAFKGTGLVAGDRCDAWIDPRGSRVIVASENGVTLFDARGGGPIAELDTPRLQALRPSAAFSPTGDVFATVTTLVQLWDSATGHLLATLNEPSPPISAQFTTDGTRLITTHESGFRFWDARTGQPQTRLVAVREYGGLATITTDGQHVVGVAPDGFLRDWDFPLGSKQEGPSIASLLEVMVGFKTNDRGAVERIEQWPDAIERERQAAGRSGGLGVWVLADRDTRTINPFATLTKDEYIRQRLATGSTDAIAEAVRLFPWDPRLSDKGVIR